MTYLVERLAELRRHLLHLHALRERVPDAAALRNNLSLHNDVLFSLLTVAQLVIDIAGELAGRKGRRFEDYTEAVRALEAYSEFSPELIDELALLPGFRNIIVHEYVSLDLERAVTALRGLEPVDAFVRIVAGILVEHEGAEEH
ncbi:MAG: HepT-like ribonuclease domain-containing protein [Gemmatimonadota bacterium]